MFYSHVLAEFKGNITRYLLAGKNDTYICEDKMIRDYMELSTEEKLNWLAEAVELINSSLTEKEKEFRRRLRESCL